MGTNIEKILQRGERIESLVERTESLAQQSMQFRSSSRGLSRQMWWKDRKIVIIGVGAALLLILLVWGIS